MVKANIIQTRFLKGLDWFNRAKFVNELLDSFKSFAKDNNKFAVLADTISAGELTETKEYNALLKKHTTVFYLPINYCDENNNFCHSIVCMSDGGIIDAPEWFNLENVRNCFDNFMYNKYGAEYIKFLKKYLSARENHEQKRVAKFIKTTKLKNDGEEEPESGR